MATPGRAVHTVHMSSSRARTPGAVIGEISLKSLVTPASSGRSVAQREQKAGAHRRDRAEQDR